jgi:hypothetical protein
MSLFQRVWLYLKCQRCGKVYETDVRFRTGFIDDSEYRLGDPVPDGVHFHVGEVHEGNADRYCEVCYRNWTVAQSIAGYESLVELIDQGRVSARDPDSGAPLSKEEVLGYGRKYTDEEVLNVPYLNVTGPYFEELELSLGDTGSVIKHDDWGDDWGKLLNMLDPLVERRLREAGWENGQCAYEDFHVFLDQNRRIIVQDLEGRRLVRFGEGERFA